MKQTLLKLMKRAAVVLALMILVAYIAMCLYMAYISAGESFTDTWGYGRQIHWVLAFIFFDLAVGAGVMIRGMIVGFSDWL